MNCEYCKVEFAGRSDKRFCGDLCRSRAWDAHFRPRKPAAWERPGWRHGHARAGRETTEYRIWCAMRERCNRVQSKEFKRYGGRGIKVCDRWAVFANFLADMGLRPSKRHSIDRIDVDGNYELGNCRWATLEVQARNKRNSILLTLNGETLHILDWSERLHIKLSTLRRRLRFSRDPVIVLRPLEKIYSRSFR